MEVNGPANIKMILQSIKEDINTRGRVEPMKLNEYLKQMEEQADLTVKYMREYAKALQNNETPPYWHEVRDGN